jgi:hypothetical protein
VSAPHAEVYLAGAYAAFLLICAGTLEWLSAHTHRRALRYRTAGFTYHRHLDAWECPTGEHLWPHEFDHERRLVRYRARAHVCNGCPVKHACTDSDDGREVVRPLDPWPHSEAGRFHRVLSLVLVALAGLVLLVEAVRHHAAIADATVVLALFVATALVGRRLARDLRAHPANFPAPTVSHGLRMAVTAADSSAPRSRWGSQNRGRAADGSAPRSPWGSQSRGRAR